MNNDNWFQELFIDEVKPALNRHSGSGYVDPNDPIIILVDESGNQVTAVLVDEETVFDATANDIREGKVAATEDGVTVGTKEIPAYITQEGFKLIPAGSKIIIRSQDYDYKKMQAIVCTYNSNMTNSVSAEKVAINNNVHPVLSTEVESIVTKIEPDQIDFGIVNDSGVPYILRYFMYKEVY